MTTVEPRYNGHSGDLNYWLFLRGGRYGEVGV